MLQPFRNTSHLRVSSRPSNLSADLMLLSSELFRNKIAFNCGHISLCYNLHKEICSYVEIFKIKANCYANFKSAILGVKRASCFFQKTFKFIASSKKYIRLNYHDVATRSSRAIL